MTPEQKKIEDEIKSIFSELQDKLAELKNDVEKETDDSKKQEKNEEIEKLGKELSEIGALIDTLSSPQEAELQSLKARLEAIQKTYQETKGEVADLQNEKLPTPTTYELLKDSATVRGFEGDPDHPGLLKIIESNPKEFKNLPGDTAEKKLEYIFTRIHNSVVLFMKNKLGDSEKYTEVINSTIAPAFEWSLMELLRAQGNKANVSMLQGVDKISFGSLGKLVRGVGNFAKTTGESYDKFNQWMNAIDYLSVHNGVLSHPEKSEVLTNPLNFKAYINNPRFKDTKFSPYTLIEGNIFGVSDEETFTFGMSLTEKQSILESIGKIKVKNDSKTTSLIAKMLDKPEKFLQKTEGLQATANGLLDGIDSLNSVTKMFGVDVLGEITKTPEKRSFLYKILDFVCKLIGITGGLEGIVKRWRMDRMNLTDEKNDNIREIFEQYKEDAGQNTSLNITDENSCKTALKDFEVTDLEYPSSTKGDYLRDSMVDNMDVSLVSPAIVKQAIEENVLSGKKENYLKEEIITVNGKQQEKITIISTGFTLDDKKRLAQYHLSNMKSHLQEYNKNNLRDFYTSIDSTDDIALCITASLYASRDDVIEGIKAKVFLPENYGSVRSNGTVAEEGESVVDNPEVSTRQFAPGEYPFANVPPYKGIAAYDLRNIKITPVLNYSELTKKHEGSVTLSGANIKNEGYEYPTNNSAGNKNNNPCDISHSGSDLGYLGFTTVADGQKLAKYDRPVDGIASAMRLLKNKYQNKSVTEIDVGGYQGYYKPDEEIGLSALRIKWITDQCNALGVGPHQMLDFNDPTTLKSFVAQVAVQETGTKIGQKLLDDAYNLAFA